MGLGSGDVAAAAGVTGVSGDSDDDDASLW